MELFFRLAFKMLSIPPVLKIYSLLGRPKVNGHLCDDVDELTRISKNELIRQKAEKLSEELQQQQNRRHGYVSVIIAFAIIFKFI